MVQQLLFCFINLLFLCLLDLKFLSAVISPATKLTIVSIDSLLPFSKRRRGLRTDSEVDRCRSQEGN